MTGRIDAPLPASAVRVVAVVGVVLAVRLVWMLGVSSAVRTLDPRRHAESRISRPEQLVLTLTGMRGAVSLAVAFAIPLAVSSGGSFPGGDDVIFLT